MSAPTTDAKSPKPHASDTDLAERRRTGDMLRQSRELARIDDEIRGLRLAVNVPITREKELKAKRAELILLAAQEEEKKREYQEAA